MVTNSVTKITLSNGGYTGTNPNKGDTRSGARTQDKRIKSPLFPGSVTSARYHGGSRKTHLGHFRRKPRGEFLAIFLDAGNDFSCVCSGHDVSIRTIQEIKSVAQADLTFSSGSTDLLRNPRQAQRDGGFCVLPYHMGCVAQTRRETPTNSSQGNGWRRMQFSRRNVSSGVIRWLPSLKQFGLK